MPTDLTAIRHQLHRLPSLSGNEYETAEIIREICSLHRPVEILTGVGGAGLAVIHDRGNPGPVVMIRCELDALPIDESVDLTYASEYAGISHKCGHDGHMTIVIGVSQWLGECTHLNGRVILLFQPAEETGKGAHAVLKDPRISQLKPDHVFALHNIPGQPMHRIILTPRQFSATVKSAKFLFTGIKSHAAEPHLGRNPAMALAELTNALDQLNRPDPDSETYTVITPVYIRLGTPDYGISPGDGEFHLTCRTWDMTRMANLCGNINGLAETIAHRHQLELAVSWFDEFPAAVNDAACNALIRRAAEENGYPVETASSPFKFGEDFGWISQTWPSAMFGLGAGIDTPNLHNPAYDFPDELIDTGVNMFRTIIELILGEPR